MYYVYKTTIYLFLQQMNLNCGELTFMKYRVIESKMYSSQGYFFFEISDLLKF